MEYKWAEFLTGGFASPVIRIDNATKVNSSMLNTFITIDEIKAVINQFYFALKRAQILTIPQNVEIFGRKQPRQDQYQGHFSKFRWLHPERTYHKPSPGSVNLFSVIQHKHQSCRCKDKKQYPAESEIKPSVIQQRKKHPHPYPKGYPLVKLFLEK